MKQLREQDKILENVKRIHMIGIGGSGMCPLAEILNSKGYILSGSDNNESDPLKRVRSLGIRVTMGHLPENVEDAELVVYSAAISEDNPELVRAHELSSPTMERSHLLGALTRKYNNVFGVCGTHGKTTVTSMITQIMLVAGLDPTAVIGGMLPMINANGRCGKTEYMVCEACEFVDTFLQMSPDVSVLLNIDNDHLEYFKTMENLTQSFKKFISMSKVAVINADDELVRKAAKGIDAKIITFGYSEECDFYPVNISPAKLGHRFDVYSKGEKLTTIELAIPGRHNVYNALAAFAACFYAGVMPDKISEALRTFTGACRRFQYIGEYSGMVLADDYAHHPTEIAATLSAAKELDRKRVTVVFQPFTFSRTAMLKDDFIKALSIADKVVLMPIMGSREKNVYGISSSDIASQLNNCVLVDGYESAADAVISDMKDGDLVITMGGGDVYKVGHIIDNRLK